MRFYISDLHFNHENLISRMDNRGFASVEAMNQYMIHQWNSRVRKNDEVVILGDFCISRKAEDVNPILAQLNGKKFLIKGNHDQFLHDKNFDQSQFQWVEPYKEVHDNNRKVILSHYPIICYNEQYRISAKGNPKTYMLYGHVHDTYDEILVNEFIQSTRLKKREIFGSDEPVSIPCQMINCFCMYSDYIPLTLDEWIVKDEKRRRKLNKTETAHSEML